jgi:hypothetical protein
MGIAAHTDVGPAAVKDLVPVRRTIGIVMWFVMVSATTTTAAATIATAARPLTIV